MPQRLLIIELNEVNFEFIERYVGRGGLPTFATLIARHGVARTRSETRYELLEPWIQWVTAHTGMQAGEHGVFRLGDIVKTNVEQIWEALETEGYLVGAMSPINAATRVRRPAFFVPDPWTTTDVIAPPVLTKLFSAIRQAVNDNTQSRLTASSVLALLTGAVRYASPSNFAAYWRLATTSRECIWRRAIFLDLLLADVFSAEVRRTRPDFASLFLNAAAHIQHHYMFSSAAYRGSHRNPPWYLAEGRDPVGEVYETYDRILAQIVDRLPDYRIMLATGLHQEPHEELTYYWRLRDHEAFLRKIGIKVEKVEPRMSRDFLVSFANDVARVEGVRLLSSARAGDGTPLFEVDDRGNDAFVMLTYPHDIRDDTSYTVGTRRFTDLRSDVSFVAVKNGQHDGVGYFLDTGTEASGETQHFQLSELFGRIFEAVTGRLPQRPSGRTTPLAQRPREVA